MNILDAMNDARLLGSAFSGPTWAAWRAVLAGAFALPMDAAQRETFARLAGGREPPAQRARELFAVVGRRGGKSRVAAGLAVYLSTVGGEVDGTLRRLAHGERGTVAVIAVDRPQARVVMGYITALLEGSPVLAPMIERIGQESVELSNGAVVEVETNSFRAVRGRTLLAAILDECAFYRSEDSATPDLETYRALLPGLATTGGLLIGISSPYARRGLLWDKWRRHYGKSGDVLIVQGASRDLNPSLPAQVVEDALRDDPEAARAEWLGQFRDDVAAFIERGTVEGAVRAGPLELPFTSGHHYAAFADPSGGGPDGFTLAIGHREGERVIVDVLRERKRLAPGAVVVEYAALLKTYGIARVMGDKYAGSWPEQEFARHGITYEAAARPKSELYLDALAMLNSGRVELPPDDALVAQFAGLERRTSRAGRDSIDHAPGGHDDRANAVAGLIVELSPAVTPFFLLGSAGIGAAFMDKLEFEQIFGQYRDPEYIR